MTEKEETAKRGSVVIDGDIAHNQMQVINGGVVHTQMHGQTQSAAVPSAVGAPVSVPQPVGSQSESAVAEEIEKLRQQLSAEKQRNDGLTSTNMTMGNDFRRLSQSISEMTARNSAANSSSATLRSEMQAFEETLAVKNKTIGTFKKWYKTHESEIIGTIPVSKPKKKPKRRGSGSLGKMVSSQWKEQRAVMEAAGLLPIASDSKWAKRLTTTKPTTIERLFAPRKPRGRGYGPVHYGMPTHLTQVRTGIHSTRPKCRVTKHSGSKRSLGASDSTDGKSTLSDSYTRMSSTLASKRRRIKTAEILAFVVSEFCAE